MPAWNTAPAETFAKAISRSFVLVVLMLGLATFTVCVPLSLAMRDMASIGDEIFEPFTTMIEITRGCAMERPTVTVCPGPTMGLRAYQTCVRRSNPTLVLVGPAMEVQVLPKLSLGVRVTPMWDEPNITIKSPPVLSKVAVVWDVNDVVLM